MVAEFKVNLGHNLGHLQTREGMAKARSQGNSAASNPSCRPSAARTIRRRYAEGEVPLADLAEEYIWTSTIYRIIHRPERDSPASRPHPSADTDRRDGGSRS